MTGRKGVRYWASWSAVCAVAAVILAADKIARACERHHARKDLNRIDEGDL